MSDLRPLTPKQQAFVREYPKDCDGAKAAVRAGYSARTAPSIACELLGKAHVKAAIIAAQAKAAERAGMDIDTHLADLKALRDKAAEEGKYSAAVTAEMARGKVAGFYVEKLDINGAVTVTVQNLTGADALKPWRKAVPGA